MKFILGGAGNWISSWELVNEAVPEADKLGFWGFIMPDHYMWGPDYRQLGGNATLETWVALGYLAAKTERINVGTIVTPIPFRPPAILAKIVATVDVISDGRAVLGVGAGWSQTEFEGYSEWNGPKTRIEKTEEGLQLILKLWKEKDRVDFDGKYYHASGAILEPKPVQKPHPPLLFGGAGKRMLRMAGRYADICFIPSWTQTSYSEAKQIVLDSARKNRPPRESQISFAAGTPAAREFGSKYDRKKYETKIEEAVEEGCGYFVVPFPHGTYLESMKDFAKNIIPSYEEKN